MPLPILNNLDDLEIASPCHREWSDMVGDDRVRHCGSCDKNVYNLSALSRADAMSLVREHEGRMCVRLFRRADNSVITNDCPVGVAAALRRAKLRTCSWAAASVAAVAGVFSVLADARVPLAQSVVTVTTRVHRIVERAAQPEQPSEMAGGIRPTMGEAPMPPPPPPRELKGKPSAPRHTTTR